jgi:hypothetical protein
MRKINCKISGRVHVDDVAGHEPDEQHADGGQVVCANRKNASDAHQAGACVDDKPSAHLADWC